MHAMTSLVQKAHASHAFHHLKDPVQIRRSSGLADLIKHRLLSELQLLAQSVLRDVVVHQT